MQPMVNWTEFRLKKVELLHADGLSASAIARRLGPAFTKAIVLRKLHQIRAEQLERAKLRAARKRAKARKLKLLQAAAMGVAVPPPPPPTAAAPPKVVVVRPASPKAAPLGVSLFDLRGDHCRWPLDDDSRPARLFCGSATVGTTSWCEHHQRLAFTGLGRPLKTGYPARS